MTNSSYSFFITYRHYETVANSAQEAEQFINSCKNHHDEYLQCNNYAKNFLKILFTKGRFLKDGYERKFLQTTNCSYFTIDFVAVAPGTTIESYYAQLEEAKKQKEQAAEEYYRAFIAKAKTPHRGWYRISGDIEGRYMDTDRPAYKSFTCDVLANSLYEAYQIAHKRIAEDVCPSNDIYFLHFTDIASCNISFLNEE